MATEAIVPNDPLDLAALAPEWKKRAAVLWPRLRIEIARRTRREEWHGHSLLQRRLDVPDFLHEIAKKNGRVLESMSKIVDFTDRPSPSLIFALIN